MKQVGPSSAQGQLLLWACEACRPGSSVYRCRRNFGIRPPSRFSIFALPRNSTGMAGDQNFVLIVVDPDDELKEEEPDEENPEEKELEEEYLKENPKDDPE
ncbi:uncharacterized protein LOC104422683 [Eucalyptus grandis]|uniref:uncharacterized protein LOC104422683 n=1 Tax=Eucalyptus grandis TaxID=71139 RepID=UPI00192EFD28|nr:uncharacterized protein LOC104422683 [Eucalyptus grandis]